MSVMMIALSGCQTSAKTGGFTSYDEHYQKNETTLKEDALSDRWESRGSKVAVVSKEKADNNDYPEAKEVLLVNNTKNKVIVSQKVFDQAYPASTTKIMTALLTLENLNLSQVVTIKHDITFPDGAAVAIHLKKGDKITVEALLNALIIMSANDAAVALGEAVAGSEANFVKMMNKRAKELGATNTHFANPNGLHLSDHYSTAYDLYLIFNAAIQNETFLEILKTTDKESVKEIIKNDIDFDKIQEKINRGATINQAVRESIQETSTDKKIELGIKVLLANKIVRISLIICVIIFVYEIIVRWIIYKKAGRHGWAAIVPIYRQITMYKVSGLSPWLILLILIPIIGAFIIAIIEIIQKFKLSKKFGKGVLFGFGLLFLQPIFESIIAFSKKIKYKG